MYSDENNNPTTDAFGKRKIPYTLPREMVPKLVWKPGIYTGYRPMNMPWSFYCRSLFWIHNETGNIWTHLSSPLFILAMFHSLTSSIDPEKNSSAHGLIISALGSCSMFLLSAMAHLLHYKSHEAHYLTFCFDFLGIVLYGYSQGLTGFYCSGSTLFYETLGSTFKWLIAISATCCLIGLALAWTLYSKPCCEKRLLQFAPCCISFVSSQLPIIFRMYECSNQDFCKSSSNIYHVLSWCFFVLGAVLFSFHQPERTFPGTFDIWGHGHQLFHLSVLAAALTSLYASYIDLSETTIAVLQLANPSFREMIWDFVSMTFINLGVILVFYLIYKVKHDKQH